MNELIKKAMAELSNTSVENIETLTCLASPTEISNYETVRDLFNDIPQVEVGDIIKFGDIWDGEGSWANSLDLDTRKGQWVYQGVTQEGDILDIGFDYDLITKLEADEDGNWILQDLDEEDYYNDQLVAEAIMELEVKVTNIW